MVFRFTRKHAAPRSLAGGPGTGGQPVSQQVTSYSRRQPRLAALTAVAAVCFSILLGGLGVQQLWLNDNYVHDEQRQILSRVLLAGPRGDILDRQGRLLVGNHARYSVVLYANELRDALREEYKNVPKTDPDRQNTARLQVVQRFLDRANALLGRNETLNAEAIKRHFAQNLSQPLTLISNLSPEEYARFNEEMPVVSPMQTAVEAVRYYPYGALAAHTLGYVSRFEETEADNVPGNGLRTFSAFVQEGATGVERAYDEQLRGTTGGEIWVVDPSGYRSEPEPMDRQPPLQGNGIRSSLDLDLQRVAEVAMGNHTGGIAVLDVQTGEILVMASKPDYDLNDTSPYISDATGLDIATREAGLNRALKGLYPPGSSFKLIVSIAGLRAGLLDADTVFECPAKFPVGNKFFDEHDGVGFGTVDLPKALQVSSNVFFYQAGLKIGPNLIADEARRFGLNEPTDVDLPSETLSMIVPDPAWKKAHRPLDGPWSGGDTVMLAIGQSFLRVTPLQMACFVASLARDETRTIPTILFNPNRSHDEVSKGAEPIGMTPAERALLLQGMERVSTIGTGRLIHNDVPEVRVAAKTGTAQYYSHKFETTAAWCVGFAPLDNPRIAFAVVIEGTDPHDNFHGGAVAGPIVGAILKEYFQQHPELKTQNAEVKNQN